MIDPPPQTPELAAPESPGPVPAVNVAPATPRKGWSRIAWLGIVLAVTGIAAVRNWPTSDQTDAHDERLGLIVLEMQCRYLVGAHALLGGLGGPAAGLYEQAATLNRGSVDQRLRFIAIAGEMANPAEALKKLSEFDNACRTANVSLTDSQRRVRAALGRLYQDYKRGDVEAASVAPVERRLLEDELGWFGKLALLPRNTADTDGRDAVLTVALRTFLVIISAAVVGVLALLAGFVGLVFFVFWASLGHVSFRLTTGSDWGGIYAETFALWLIGYVGMNLAVGWLSIQLLPDLWQSGLLMLLSIAVLAWPLLRGVSFRQLRADIGWTCGNPFAEIASGIACYLINLPIVFVGVIITIVLLLTQGALPGAAGGDDFSSPASPAHPIVRFIAEADWTSRLQIYLIACVLAPIVEETMFRGLLYRHCRELTARVGRLGSAAFSTVVVSLIFAAIHPQGLVAIPPLMFMAFGFSLAREWRSSLLPCMFAHGMSNGIVTTVAMIALGS
jgi:membrane protease YdiL (CAAX protease family)